MSSAVRLAAMMPASLAVCSGSPFLIAPARICRIASRDMVMRPPATASRAVVSLLLTSTIRTVPVASTCERLRDWRLGTRDSDAVWRRSASGFDRGPSPEPRAPTLLLPIGISLREKERQALERHGEVHALYLHVCRHLQRARR